MARQTNESWWVLSGKLSWSASPHPSRTSFFAPDFALKDSTPWLLGSRAEKLTSEELSQRLQDRFLSGASSEIAITELEEPAEEEFLQRHQQILASIARGQFAKVVPAVLAKASLRAEFPALVDRLLKADPHQWPYAFSVNENGMENGMIGLTPEILFRKEGRNVFTQAVAGTAARQSETSRGLSLLENPKERLEHQLVVEDLSRELWPLGEVEVGETTEKPAGSLKHLVTPLVVKMKQDIPFEDLARRLHPSAALGGYPRAEARIWLEEQPEFLARRRFGAPFGWREPSGDGVCLVAIRNLQWQNGKASIGSGCGVVAGSLGHLEWQELKMKRFAILQALGVTV